MIGIVIAFKDYNPFSGFWGSPWVGLQQFERFFSEPSFVQLFRNTFFLSMLNLILFFPLPIIFALLLNEVKRMRFKRFVQTLIYVPHFVSWVVVVGISYMMFTTEGGIVNEIIARLGGEKVAFLLDQSWFRPMYLGQVVWKEVGWGTIIFLAALAGVDTEQYEAAYMDGANRWQQLLHVTLPAIRSTIVILLILRLGDFLETGFEHIFLMITPMNREVSEVFDTYVYSTGIQQGNYSYSAAVGLFKSVIGLILVLTANRLAIKMNEEGIF
jgi:putative aldouronate transport system permease protein